MSGSCIIPWLKQKSSGLFFASRSWRGLTRKEETVTSDGEREQATQPFERLTTSLLSTNSNIRYHQSQKCLIGTPSFLVISVQEEMKKGLIVLLPQWIFGISLPCRALNEIGRAASCAAGCMPLPFSSTQWKSALLIIVMHLCRKGKVKKNRKSVAFCHTKHVLHLVWSAPNTYIYVYVSPLRNKIFMWDQVKN